MIPTQFAPIASHIWQSTLFAAAAVLLTLALRRNQARVRYAVLLAASYKFLLPFSWLVALGREFQWHTVPALPHVASTITDVISAPTFLMAPVAANPVPDHPALLPLAVWLLWTCGLLIVVAGSVREWMRLRAIVGVATTLPSALPIPVVSTRSGLEPGVFGVFRPVLVLPEGIAENLTPAQLRAVIAHELCHVRRRDNLAAAIHMLVEALFWFHPLVWWLDSRIVREREQACDEEVLRWKSAPLAYAEAILAVCKSYVESPVACMSGMSGSDLKQRLVNVMANRRIKNLSPAGRLLLSALGIIALAAPIIFGVANVPLLHAQSGTTNSTKAAGSKVSFDVASVKLNKVFGPTNSNIPLSGDEFPLNGGRLTITNVRLHDLITFAYKLDEPESNDLEQAIPKTMMIERFDIDARAPQGTTKDQMRLMMQSLLEDRFKLKTHFETQEKPIFKLVLVKPGETGPQLRPHADGRPCSPSGAKASLKMVVGEVPVVCHNMGVFPRDADGSRPFAARDVTMQEVAYYISLLSGTGHHVVDQTGLTGNFDFLLSYSQATPTTTDAGAPPVDSGPIFPEALKNQLGLKLEPSTGPVESLIIDHVEQPTPN